MSEEQSGRQPAGLFQGRDPGRTEAQPGREATTPAAALTVQLHGAEGLVLELQLREHYGVVPEVGAQHPVLQHTQG